jgi:hypothetical protein
MVQRVALTSPTALKDEQCGQWKDIPGNSMYRHLEVQMVDFFGESCSLSVSRAGHFVL